MRKDCCVSQQQVTDSSSSKMSYSYLYETAFWPSLSPLVYPSHGRSMWHPQLASHSQRSQIKRGFFLLFPKTLTLTLCPRTHEGAATL